MTENENFLFWMILLFNICLYAQLIKHTALDCYLRGDLQWNQRAFIFFWRVLKESLVPGFKSLFMQESPSVSVSVMLNPMPTQSRPLTGFSSVICANVSWQLAQHGAALTGPLHGPAGRRGPTLEEGATTCYMAITLTRGQRHRPTLQRPQHPPSVAVETVARLDSSRRIGFATPMGVWNERRGGFGGEIGRLAEERSSDQTPGSHCRQGAGKIPRFLLL